MALIHLDQIKSLSFRKSVSGNDYRLYSEHNTDDLITIEISNENIDSTIEMLEFLLDTMKHIVYREGKK